MLAGAHARRIAAAVLVASSLSLTACSSSGGGSAPSQSKIEQQLKKDPDFGPLLKQLPAGKSNLVTSCVAKAMQKGISAGELNDFANGKKKLKDLKGKGGVSDTAAQKDAENCVTSAAGS